MADHGEKPRFGAVGRFGQIARRGKGAFGLDPVGDIAADALHFGAGFGAHGNFAPGGPAGIVANCDFLIVRARAVGQHRDRALFAHRERGWLAEQLLAAFAGERAIGVVGVGQQALCVAADDQVTLRLQQAAGAHLGLAQFPVAVGQCFDSHFQGAHFLSHGAAPRQHEGDDGAGGGEQRAGPGGVIVRIVTLARQADAGEEAEARRDDR